LMLLAFRDEAYINWPQFDVGMNCCVATLVQNKLDGDPNSILEPYCGAVWHGGPGYNNLGFNPNLNAEYYQMMNVKEIATNCKNFAGRNDYQEGSGNSYMQSIRQDVCSMFWFKIFKERPQLFVDFNDKLYQHYAEDIGLYHQYTPPDYTTMMSWLRELMPTTIERTNKNTWLNEQWIIKNGITDSAYNLLLNSYIQSVAPGWDSHICYFYMRGDAHNMPYELPLRNEPIDIKYNDSASYHNEAVVYTNFEGWILMDIGTGDFYPIPSATPQKYTLEATSVNAGTYSKITDILYNNRSGQELFGCVQYHNDGQVVITNHDTSQS